MSYNPYDAEVDSTTHNRLQQPQPQRSFVPQQQQQQQYNSQMYQQQGQFQQQNNQQQHNQQQQQQQQQNQGIFGNDMFNDPTAAMTFQAGQTAMRAGTQYMNAEIHKYVPVGAIKAYFKVSNSYVLSKLLLIVFPFRHQRWERSERRPDPSQDTTQNSYVAEGFAYPMDDKNAPDFYIPLMGLVTYILLSAMISGLKGEFHPQVFSLQTSSTLAYLLLDLAILKGGLYMLNVSSNTYDLISYTGYKFVPIILILVISNISSFSGLNWLIYIYLFAAYGFFELRAIRFNLFTGNHNSAHTMRNRTNKSSNYFLLIYSFVVQGLLLWGLTRP